MKDVKGFCRLFDLQVPCFQEIDYYLDQLSKTHRYRDVKELYRLYELAELEIDNLYDFRVQKTKEIIDYLQVSHAYTELTYDNSLLDLPTNKDFTPVEKKNYVSIDMRQANWQALTRYDHFNQFTTYNDLLKQFGMPEIFYHSRFLRQFIFGNLNPKKQAKVQRNIIQEVVDQMSSTELHLECIRHDEVIFSHDSTSYMIEKIKLIDLEKFRPKIYRTTIVEDFRVNLVLNMFDENKSGEILYKELSACDGLKYFMKLKQYILNESLDIRDLYFHVDGKIAIWKVDNLKLELV